ncbi:hypothetical protein M378DRAFT_165333 [Amanita muscaria Koide BX008]|uniref:Uncharacterized protein n=1 Tax=Amanita muscaria (strain Koide BX008) TaxID=946122 RepID=A0A0C2WM92_AMAMK|nr:hypothetical protein M378DRAFT_165333 [Amanita muscaria Koide BX008]
MFHFPLVSSLLYSPSLVYSCLSPELLLVPNPILSHFKSGTSHTSRHSLSSPLRRTTSSSTLLSRQTHLDAEKFIIHAFCPRAGYILRNKLLPGYDVRLKKALAVVECA